jgi:hypothetical protein
MSILGQIKKLPISVRLEAFFEFIISRTDFLSRYGLLHL